MHAGVPLAVRAATADAGFISKTAMAIASAASHQWHGHTIEDFIRCIKAQGSNHLLSDERSKTGKNAVKVTGAAIDLALGEEARKIGAPVLGSIASDLAFGAGTLWVRDAIEQRA
jgi:hypothetical protein